MNQAAPEPESDQDIQDIQDSQYARDILQRLINTGAAMAEEVHQEAKANALHAAHGATPMADATVAFDRVARAVRRCIVLMQHGDKPARGQAPGLGRTGMRKQVIRRVEDAIHREAAPYEGESLRAEMLERLDAPEFEDDLGRPVREIIDEICADLGILGPDSLDHWKRRTPRDIAELCAQAASAPLTLPMPAPGWADPAWRAGGLDDGTPRAQSGP